MTSFTLLVWTCQQVYFDNPLANRIKCSDYFDKFSLLTHTDEQNLYFDKFWTSALVIEKIVSKLRVQTSK